MARNGRHVNANDEQRGGAQVPFLEDTGLTQEQGGNGSQESGSNILTGTGFNSQWPAP